MRKSPVEFISRLPAVARVWFCSTALAWATMPPLVLVIEPSTVSVSPANRKMSPASVLNPCVLVSLPSPMVKLPPRACISKVPEPDVAMSSPLATSLPAIRLMWPPLLWTLLLNWTSAPAERASTNMSPSPVDCSPNPFVSPSLTAIEPVVATSLTGPSAVRSLRAETDSDNTGATGWIPRQITGQ